MAIASNSGEGWVRSYATFDGGLTWTSSLLPSPTGRAAEPTQGMTDPTIVVLPDHSVIASAFTFHDIQSAGTRELVQTNSDGLLVARSVDGGKTFGNALVIQQGEGVIEVNDAFFASTAVHSIEQPTLLRGDASKVFLFWTEHKAPRDAEALQDRYGLENSDLYWSSSSDGGQTWTAPRLALAGHYIRPMPVLQADGALQVALIVYEPTIHYALATSTDGGATWTEKTVAMNGTYDGGPSLAQGTIHGRGLLAFAYGHADGSVTTPELVTSKDGGTTWSQPLELDKAEAAGGIFPGVAVAPDGSIVATYYHATGPRAASYRAVVVANDTIAARLVLDPNTEPVSDFSWAQPTPDGVAASWISDPQARLVAMGLITPLR